MAAAGHDEERPHNRLTICTLALFLLYYGHSLRSKAGQPSVIPVVTNVGEKFSPSLSPDGQQLAFAWNGGTGPDFSIYVKLIGTEESLRLTKQASIDFNPVWSPDGRYIAFCRIQKGQTGIYIIPAIGGAERKVREAHWQEQDFRFADSLRRCVRGVLPILRSPPMVKHWPSQGVRTIGKDSSQSTRCSSQEERRDAFSRMLRTTGV